MTRLIWSVSFALIIAVIISGLFPQVCVAGQPTPCQDTEHPSEPPCNMKSCKRFDGSSVCSHYCTKGKGCCKCDPNQCTPTMPAHPNPDEGEDRPQ